MDDDTKQVTDKFLQDFSDRMFATMTTMLTELPFAKLVEMHDYMVDKYEDTEGTDEAPPVSFALTALHEAIRKKHVNLMMN